MTENTKLEASMARLEGVVITEIKHLSHDVRNLSMRLDGYATQRDLDKACARIDKVEERATWNSRAGIGFALSVVGSVIAGLLLAYLKFAH